MHVDETGHPTSAACICLRFLGRKMLLASKCTTQPGNTTQGRSEPHHLSIYDRMQYPRFIGIAAVSILRTTSRMNLKIVLAPRLWPITLNDVYTTIRAEFSSSRQTLHPSCLPTHSILHPSHPEPGRQWRVYEFLMGPHISAAFRTRRCT